MGVQEWRALVAAMLLLPHRCQTVLLVMYLAANFPQISTKLMHNCIAASLLPCSKGRAGLFVSCEKSIDKNKANYLADFYFNAELLADSSLLCFSRSGELMTALHRLVLSKLKDKSLLGRYFLCYF